MVTNEGPSDGGVRENFNFILTSHQGLAELETYSGKKTGKIDSMLQSLFFFLKDSGQIPYNSEIFIPYEDFTINEPSIKDCGLETETWPS